MTPAKQARLQAAGWQVGAAEQFLDLTAEAAERVEARMQRLAHSHQPTPDPADSSSGHPRPDDATT